MRKADVARHTVVVQTLQVHKVLEHLLIAPVCVRSNPQPLQNAAILSAMIASTQCPLSPADTPAHSTTPTKTIFLIFLTASRQEPANGNRRQTDAFLQLSCNCPDLYCLHS